MKSGNRNWLYLATVVLFCTSCGGGGSISGGGGISIPAAPIGLTATAGNAQVSLSWSASNDATSYHVKRSTTSGGPYSQVGGPALTTYTDTGLTNGTPYYYVVSAINAGGESANSAEATATPMGTTSVTVSIDTLSNRRPISPLVYGGAYPKDAATITDSGLTVVRWGGNATSTYNWQLQTYNADNDWYFEDFNYTEIGDGDSVQFIKDVQTAGSSPLMTMVMLPWVAKSAEDGINGHWSFSVVKYGAQCVTDQYNSDAGNGIVQGTCNSNPPTYLTADPNDAYVPLKDDPAGGDPAGTVYRHAWVTAMATAFAGPQHFYDMDNETDIWGGTHRDIHPNPSGYDELRDTYLTNARNLKTWDNAAFRLGPVSCCWWFYWNGANGGDKAAHAGQDFLPWWLNEVYWRDQIDGVQSLDVFDIHAYPDGPDTTNYTLAQKRALATRIYRDYWDPTYTSESGTITQSVTTSIQPNHAIPFRIPRMRALLNMNYPGVPLAITEWSAEFAGGTQAARSADFSTAIGDADAYGILGRERVYLASRWTAPDPANPNYQALKLYTNYDGAHHAFGTTSVSATHNGDPNLFSVYAAVGPTGTPLTIMVLNKDPGNSANVTFNLNNFTTVSCTAYTLSQSSPNSIVTSTPSSCGGSLTFVPYSVTLLVMTGVPSSVPAAEWDLNPDTVMAPAGGTVTLSPHITSARSGTAFVTLSAPTIDSGGGTITITKASVTQTLLTGDGTINITAGTTLGVYHFTVTGTENSGVVQTQGSWLVVGNPPATLTITTDPQSGTRGTPITLGAKLVTGASGASWAAGATIRFTTDAGTLSGGTAGNAISQLVTTDANGVANITLMLPATAGPVNVTAEGPYQLGHPVATFTETAQ